ncbi:hypothetical protein SEA_TRAAWW1_43 [Mycobacterium phage Traaww1]|nr:hypothetical protein SEA_GLEXAN_45 [Mycobacterium phage Glexan]QDH92009.1 hypothetical protein SEA_FLYPOTENUSE_42 [Mycobacterium phage Flypotenuse]QGJ91952.1 hypothetical protein SEA_TRAAWW1_43 [Mycobacterium phage Traaww1]QPL14780.1 hypothetical protein SEA_HARELLA_47 [Mycobacterium phage Harella]
MKCAFDRAAHRLRGHRVREASVKRYWVDYWGEAGAMIHVFICTCGTVWRR